MWEFLLVAWHWLIRLFANPFRPTRNEYEVKLMEAQDRALRHIQARLDEEREAYKSALLRAQKKEVYLQAEIEKSKKHREECERLLHKLEMVEEEDKKRIGELEKQVIRLKFRVQTLERKTGVPPGSAADFKMPEPTGEDEGETE